MTQCFNEPVFGPDSVTLIGGIFVGGRSVRMGGRPKGLLVHDGETLVARWRRLLAGAGVTPVLVGRNEAYDAAGLETLDDAEGGRGPLGGLVALLERAGQGQAIAIACDMPYVSAELLEALLRAPSAVAVAPRRNGAWEPMFSRWDAPRALPIARARLEAGALGLQRLLDEVGASTLDLADHERELDDWDTPDDLR
jgi:molybdopterin-guanine dinucleotide biosynthesis protein A